MLTVKIRTKPIICEKRASAKVHATHIRWYTKLIGSHFIYCTKNDKKKNEYFFFCCFAAFLVTYKIIKMTCLVLTVCLLVLCDKCFFYALQCIPNSVYFFDFFLSDFNVLYQIKSHLLKYIVFLCNTMLDLNIWRFGVTLVLIFYSIFAGFSFFIYFVFGMAFEWFLNGFIVKQMYVSIYFLTIFNITGVKLRIRICNRVLFGVSLCVFSISL